MGQRRARETSRALLATVLSAPLLPTAPPHQPKPFPSVHVMASAERMWAESAASSQVSTTGTLAYRLLRPLTGVSELEGDSRGRLEVEALTPSVIISANMHSIKTCERCDTKGIHDEQTNMVWLYCTN